MPSLPIPLLFQLAGVVTMAACLIKLLTSHTGGNTKGQWVVCGGVCLASVAWLSLLLFVFKSVFGFAPVLGGTLIVSF